MQSMLDVSEILGGLLYAETFELCIIVDLECIFFFYESFFFLI